jgi:hypothetical protein
MLQGDNEYICPSGTGLVFVLNLVGFCLYRTQNRTLVLECGGQCSGWPGRVESRPKVEKFIVPG